MAGQKDAGAAEAAATQEYAQAQKARRVPLVVKLTPEDRKRLDYVCEQTDQTKACLVRRLIREASEGEMKTATMTLSFKPYSEA